MKKKGQCMDPEYAQEEVRKRPRIRDERKEGEKSRPPACPRPRPVWEGYLGNAAGPAAREQLTRGAEAVLVEAGG